MRPQLIKPELVPANNERHLITVRASVAAGDGFHDAGLRNAADARQRVAHDTPLPFELSGIPQVLDLAAAASAEYGAKGFHPLGRRFQQLEQLADGVLRFNARNAHPRPFARQDAEAEDDESAVAPDALSVREQIVEA